MLRFGRSRHAKCFWDDSKISKITCRAGRSVFCSAVIANSSLVRQEGMVQMDAPVRPVKTELSTRAFCRHGERLEKICADRSGCTGQVGHILPDAGATPSFDNEPSHRFFDFSSLVPRLRKVTKVQTMFLSWSRSPATQAVH